MQAPGKSGSFVRPAASVCATAVRSCFHRTCIRCIKPCANGMKDLRNIPKRDPHRGLCWEDLMADNKFLTPEEVSERYRGGISVGTLRNWRAMRIGPTFVKIGKSVLYPINELDAWDQKNMVACRASKRHRVDADEGA
jgi:hypothetical protein